MTISTHNSVPLQRTPERVKKTKPTPSRLTRRGRVVLLAVLVVFAFIAFSMGHTTSRAGTGHDAPATRAVTVEQGQTLWQIAKTAVPGADPRDTIDRIRDLNGMSTTSLRAGQRLIVPA